MDPYVPEPDLGYEPVRLRLSRLDGRIAVVLLDVRAMSDRSIILHEGVHYGYQGTDQLGGVWYRLYIEVGIIDTRTMLAADRGHK